MNIEIKSDLNASENYEPLSYLMIKENELTQPWDFFINIYFVNEKHFFNNKSFYIVNVILSEYDFNINNSSYRFEMRNINSLFYLKTSKGLVQLFSDDKNKPFHVVPKLTRFDETNLGTTSKLLSIYVPCDILETNEIEISASFGYDVYDTYNNYTNYNENSSAKIYVDTRYIIEERDNKYIIKNFVSERSICKISGNKLEQRYEDIVQKEISFDFNEDNSRVDFDLQFEYQNFSYYDFYFKGIYSSIEFDKTVQDYLKNVVGHSIIETKNRIIDVTKDFFDIKEFNDSIIKTKNSYEIKSDIKTIFDWETNKVIASDKGERGVVKNPLYNKEVVFEKEFKFNDLIFLITNFSKNDDLKFTISAVDEIDDNFLEEYKISFSKLEWNDLNDTNVKEGVDFIIERQEKIL